MCGFGRESWHLFTLAISDYSLPKHPSANTHAHTFALKRKGSLDFVGSEGRTGKTKLILKQSGKEHRKKGKLQEGKREGRGVGGGLG